VTDSFDTESGRVLELAAFKPIDAPYGSPRYWLERLMRRLDARWPEYARFEAYYDGAHPLSFFDDKVREAFGERFSRFASNFTALVIDSIAERIQVNGFRFKDDSGDDDLWAIWQENDLDGGSLMAHTEALIKSTSYTLVEPRGGDTPRITVEDPLDTIVELDPRDRRKRLAGLKRWLDDDQHLVVYVYLPNAVYKYRTDKPWRDSMRDASNSIKSLAPMLVSGESWPLSNPMGVVPIVPLPNRPRARQTEGRSEVEVIASNQDLINYYRVMAVIAARYTAYPQRWVKNLPIALDPVTGLPAQPFKGGMADLWQIEPYGPDDPRALNSAAQPEFGQFLPGSVEPYIRLIEHEVASMTSIAAVPYFYVLNGPTAIPPSGESLKSSEARLINKVNAIEVFFGEGWEETMRVALLAMQDERAHMRVAETRWVNTETRNEAVHTDAIVKQGDLLDDETALEELGYSPQQIKRIAERKKKAADEAAKNAPPPVAPANPLDMLELPPAPLGPQMSPTPPTSEQG
jgi:hypothetical protein